MMLWADSFDHYGATEALMADGAWADVGSTALSTAQARTGASSLLVAGNDTCRRVFGGAKVTSGVAAAFFFASLPASSGTNTLFAFCDAANIAQVTISCASTGVIEAYRANGAGSQFVNLLGATAAPVITASAWNHIEAKVKIDDSTGTIEVRVNGVTVLNLTGQDTKASGLTEASQVRFAQSGAGAAGFYLDDVIAWDTTGALNNDFIGDRKVVTDFPTADTADVAWTRSTGSTNFGVIDENPPNDDTDYLTTLNVGDKFGVTFPNLPAEVNQVSAVIFIHRTKKTDAGTANVKVTLKSAGVPAVGADRPMTTAYTFYHDIFETDPNTAAPFTRAAAQAASLTGERTA